MCSFISNQSEMILMFKLNGRSIVYILTQMVDVSGTVRMDSSLSCDMFWTKCFSIDAKEVYWS